MKTQVFLCIVAILLLNACCDKKECEGSLTVITPYGFDTTDMYRTVIERYDAYSNFSKRIDSMPLAATRYANNGLITYSYNFQAGIDCKIIFKESGKTFQVTNVQLEQGVCDHCTFNLWGETHYDYFKLCKVNGTWQYGALELHSQ